ncbi:MAG: late control protein D [Vibrio sp.]
MELIASYAPQFSISANGVDITSNINAALIDISIDDHAGGKSDQLTLNLDGEKIGKLPPVDAVLRVSLGFNGVLFPQGAFTVDGRSCQGFPEVVTINATAAPLGGADAKSSIQSQRTQSWEDITLEDLLKTVATRNSLKPLIAEELKGTVIKHLDQTAESDLALLTRLARQYSAVSKVSNENWMLMLTGAGKNASGTQTLPIRVIDKSQCSSYSYSDQSRTKVKSTVAKWHDKETGKKGTCKKGEGKPAFQISYVYPSKEEAQAAVNSRKQEVESGSETFNCSLAATKALLQAFAEGHIKVTGFRDEITSKLWRVAKISKKLTKGGGLIVSFDCDNGAKEEK